jgi:hypothetical protein
MAKVRLKISPAMPIDVQDEIGKRLLSDRCSTLQGPFRRSPRRGRQKFLQLAETGNSSRVSFILGLANRWPSARCGVSLAYKTLMFV